MSKPLLKSSFEITKYKPLGIDNLKVIVPSIKKPTPEVKPTYQATWPGMDKML